MSPPETPRLTPPDAPRIMRRLKLTPRFLDFQDWVPPVRLRTLLPLSAALLTLATAVHARTARDLSARMRIDGYTTEFIAGDEDVFGTDPQRGILQEPRDDSKWQNNEVYQVRVTWDAQYLYIATEGKIWGNNMILIMDTVPNRGLGSMTSLNSWRRNFTFDTFARFAGDEFVPDVLGATWDTNTNPRFLTQLAGNQVDDRQVGSDFRAVASFDQGNDGRSMEFAIPWRNVFAGLAGVGTRDTFMTVNGVADTLRRLPLGVHSIKLAVVVTGGGDGTGGPDAAPDNLRGCSDNSNDNIIIDNYAILDLDQDDDTGLGHGGPDGIPDWNCSPITRVSFRYPPPITALRFSIQDVTLDRPAFAPDMNEAAGFHVTLSPPLNPNDPLDQARTCTFSANIFDARGRWVRNLFLNTTVPALTADQSLRDLGLTQWDGRDGNGARVSPGIYILRLVIEPNLDRAVKALVVVR